MRAKSSRSCGWTGLRNPSSSAPFALPYAVVGITIAYRAGARPAPELTGKKSGGSSCVSIARLSTNAWRVRPPTGASPPSSGSA